jgi:uncharacterized spore protein YtfJ
MSQSVPNMLENTISKIREMVDVNSVIGTPITTPDGVTITLFPKSALALVAAAVTMPSPPTAHSAAVQVVV